MMRTPLLLLAVLVLPLPAAATGPEVQDLPPFGAADPGAAPVTAENVLQRERFWPYQVALVRAWEPGDGRRALPSGTAGVLVRVEPGGRARIDFGRDGLYAIPLSATDLVEGANRVRRGELDKIAANFVLALGPRLLHSDGEPMRPVRLTDVFTYRSFLAVFASLDQLEAIAPVLAPLAHRKDVMTLVLPQGELPDAQVRERLRALHWEVPFVYDHLAEPYTPSLLPEGMRPPAVVLQSAEGRVLFASAWSADVGAGLSAALDR
jgi:hypothetical protein